MRRRGGDLALILCAALSAAALLLALGPPRVPSPAQATAPPRRVAIYPPLLAAMLTLDGASHVAAAAEGEVQLVHEKIPSVFFPRADEIASLTTRGGRSSVPVDAEQILLLSPDRVILWPWATSGVEATGAPVAMVKSTDLVETWRELGRIAGATAKADTLLAGFARRMAHLRDETASMGSAPRVALIWRNLDGAWMFAGGGHREIATLRDLGAAPLQASASGSRRINDETLLAIDPDVIFLACCASEDDRPATLASDPVLRLLRAVRQRRVYKQPKGAMRMDGVVEWPLLIDWCVELLYPERAPKTLRADIKNAYASALGRAPDDNDIDAMVFMADNKGSAFYDRFAR